MPAIPASSSISAATVPTASTSLTVHQSRQLSLFCWILDISERSVPVDIGDHLTVGHLQKEIVKQNPVMFEGVDGLELDLWETSLPIDRQLKNHVSNQQFLEDDVLLEGIRLSKLFPPPGPAEETLHIVVRHPRPRSPRKRIRLEDSETPQTPVCSQVGLPEKQTPPRLRRRQLTPNMKEALEPFDQYMTDLAEGRLDDYFDHTQIQPSRTYLKVTLPSGPMLLLHDLGNCPDDPRLTGIFKEDTVQVFAVSGSGKTRICLEGLCHQWGFYISCGGASKDRAAGSTDFLAATETMSDMSGWDEHIEDTVSVADPNKNINVARRAFEMLICSRLFVLKDLLEKLPPGTDGRSARRRWVLVQAMPPSGRFDIFATVLKSLRCAESRDMSDLCRSMLDDMTKIIGAWIFPSNQQFFAVIDEAQVAAEYMNESFRSLTTGTHGRPVLYPFYRFLLDSEIFKGVILAGTGLSKKMVQKAVASRIAQRLDKSQNPLIFYDVGRFTNDGTDHRAYVEKYFSFASTAANDELMKRILYWLSGRYRFTASFIELLLLTQSTSRHRLLTAFIHGLTGFRLTDATDLEEQEDALPNGILEHIENFYGSFTREDRLFGKLNGNSSRYIFDAFMRWRIGSQPTTIHIKGDMHQTIASGIGHLAMMKPDEFLAKDSYFAYLCEPLVVLYLSSIFAQRPETTNLSWLSDATFTARNNTSLGFIFEEAVLMILLQMFGGEPRALSDAFHTDQSWGSRKVILVSLKRRADGQMESCPVSWTSGSSDRLGFKATSPAQVIEFLNNPDGKCFLFPDTHMGPDLSWFFQDWETKELILGIAQQKLSKSLTPEQWRRALQTVDPDFFYTVKKRAGGRVQYAPLKYPDLLEDVMNALDVKLGPAEYEPSISDQHPKTRSVAKKEENFGSQPRRLTPKYLRIIATPDDHQRERLKANWKGNVGVLRSECVEQYFPNIVWTTPPSVAF